MIESRQTAEVIQTIGEHIEVRIQLEVIGTQLVANEHAPDEPMVVDINNIKSLLMSHLSAGLKRLEDIDHQHGGHGFEVVRPQASVPQVFVMPTGSETKH